MKPWYRSRTIWLNVLGAVTAGAAEVPGLLAQFGMGGAEDGLRQAALYVLIVGNVIMRSVTKRPIGRAA